MKRGATVLVVFALLLAALMARAIDVPSLTGPVVDRAALLSDEDRATLEGMLRKLHQSGRAQMTILITDSLQDTDIESFSMAVAEKWQLGRKGKDQGLLLVVAPKERKMRFEVGYGLEGELTDAFTRRVLDNGVRPYFREGRYSEGLMVAVQSVARKLGVDIEGPVQPLRSQEPRGHLSPFAIFLLLILFFVFLMFRGPWFWGGGFGGGGWGGGGGWSGGGGGWSSGGGGWSGGGGGFGGGGSSSSW